MARKSNKELCDDFRELLTGGFHITEDGISCSDLMDGAAMRNEALRVTKPWRNELWKTFREIEDRLCPLEALGRERSSK